MQDGRAIGILLFYSTEKDVFDDEVIKLIERMARNLTFALDNFGHDAERKVIEEALQASEARYRNILETMENAYCEVDLKGRHIFFNGAYAKLTGYPAAELKELTYPDYQTDEMARKCPLVFNEVFRTGVSKKNQEWGFLHKDGSILLLEGSIQLLKDERGNAIGFCSVVRDITARRKAEQALRESEARFRALTNLSSDWYWEQDVEFRITRIESRHMRLNRRGHPYSSC
jgi:PAS domain S-box-containing protein